jgi:hypothetical protein
MLGAKAGMARVEHGSIRKKRKHGLRTPKADKSSAFF